MISEYVSIAEIIRQFFVHEPHGTGAGQHRADRYGSCRRRLAGTEGWHQRSSELVTKFSGLFFRRS